jgi:hypothetical protein
MFEWIINKYSSKKISLFEGQKHFKLILKLYKLNKRIFSSEASNDTGSHNVNSKRISRIITKTKHKKLCQKRDTLIKIWYKWKIKLVNTPWQIFEIEIEG